MRKSNCRKEELEIRNRKLYDKNAELGLECDAGMIGNKVIYTKMHYYDFIEDL